MTKEELLKASNKQEQIIADYLLKYSEEHNWDYVETTQKPLADCMKPIKDNARKLATDGCACVADDEVYKWAVAFYEGTTPAIEKPKTVKVEKKVEKKPEKKVTEDDEQLSLFDFM